jgi:transposase-like protein
MRELLISIDISFTLNGDFSIANLSEKIHGLEVEKLILHEFIDKYGEMITRELCGKKYKHYKKEKRYSRAGTSKRKIITMVGELDLQVDKIRDKKTGEIFKPLLRILGIEPYKNYQDDISFTCTDIATKNTYRDTQYILKNFFKKTISPSTINRRVIEIGKEIKEFMKIKNKDNKDETYDYLYADGTKSHSQENRYKNEVQVAITTNQQGEKVLLSCNVNKSWGKLNQEITELDVLSPDAVLVSDAEPELKNALTTAERKHQLDFIHFIRDIGYQLWKDNKLKLDTRKKLKKLAEEIIYTLKNQTKKYKGNKKTLKKKINQAVDKLKEFSKHLQELGCEKTAKFVKKHSNHIVTFAILAKEEKNIPWNSNIIERLMGEIQKRCKHKWMRWTTQGQESILNLILTRYTNPQNYTKFKKQKLQTKNTTNIQTKITT